MLYIRNESKNRWRTFLCVKKLNFLYHQVLQIKSFWPYFCVKAPGLRDRKVGCIALILPTLRSRNRGSFHAKNKA